MTLDEHWDRHAHEWAAWARTREHDGYYLVRESFFPDVVPSPGRATLEVGCGEGRVCRDLGEHGHSVTGVDLSPTMVELAREADPDGSYVVGDACALPFDDASFDLVVSYNALMNIDDLDGAVREAARVLTAAGRLAICVVHPMSYVFRRGDGEFVFEGDYFERRTEVLRFERNGIAMTFADRVRPLEDYARALSDAGFVIERLREVSDDDPPVRPQFMFLRCVKRAP